MATKLKRLKKENVSVFDVWTSQAAFDPFGQTMTPILQAAEVKAKKPAKTMKAKKRPKSTKSTKSSKKR